MSRPEPRPALQRAEDGSVHPAAPRVSPEVHIHPVPHAPAAASRKEISKAGTRPAGENTAAPEFTGKPAKLSVEVPKDLRKEVRKLAERSGQSVDAVVVEALSAHVSGKTGQKTP